MIFEVSDTLEMKPFNTVEDVSINEKSPEEAMALLPIWLRHMLKMLWEKR